jgi:hypothetical protein
MLVKIFIPCHGVKDVGNLSLYHFNGMKWRRACDADGNILSGGEGWLVPGSRVNHNDANPPLIEIEVYHFSAAQAVNTVPTGIDEGGSGGGGDG